jgi:hypothetical protein
MDIGLEFIETVTEIAPNELWHRICIKGELEGTRELGVVPVNQKWSLQSIVTNGVANSSPAFAIFINEYLLAAVDKEGVGQETFDGNMAALPGETIMLVLSGKGKYEITLTFIREKRGEATPRFLHTGRTMQADATRESTDEPARAMGTTELGVDPTAVTR